MRMGPRGDTCGGDGGPSRRCRGVCGAVGCTGPRLLVDQALHTPSSRRRTLTSRRRSSGRSFARCRSAPRAPKPLSCAECPAELFVHDRPPDFLDTYGYTMCPARPEFSDSRYRGHARGIFSISSTVTSSDVRSWSLVVRARAGRALSRYAVIPVAPEGVAIGRRSGRGPLGGQFDRHAIQANAEITRV